MATTRKAAAISHEELQIAIRRFQKNGGIIQKLPDQKNSAPHAVGGKGNGVDADAKPDLTL
jgi:hypothetical protein